MSFSRVWIVWRAKNPESFSCLAAGDGGDRADGYTAHRSKLNHRRKSPPSFTCASLVSILYCDERGGGDRRGEKQARASSARRVHALPGDREIQIVDHVGPRQGTGQRQERHGADD